MGHPKEMGLIRSELMWMGRRPGELGGEGSFGAERAPGGLGTCLTRGSPAGTPASAAAQLADQLPQLLEVLEVLPELLQLLFWQHH